MDLNLLRKKLLYRSKHRGCKENDIILSRYAEDFLHSMIESNLIIYADFLEESDNDIYDWSVGRSSPPEKYGFILEKILTNR